MTGYVQTVNIQECSACGEDHRGVMVVRMDQPREIDGLAYPYVGACPSTNAAVYVLFIGEQPSQ